MAVQKKACLGRTAKYVGGGHVFDEGGVEAVHVVGGRSLSEDVTPHVLVDGRVHAGGRCPAHRGLLLLHRLPVRLSGQCRMKFDVMIRG